MNRRTEYVHCDDPPPPRQSDDAAILHEYAWLVKLVDSKDAGDRQRAFAYLGEMATAEDALVRLSARVILLHFFEDDPLNLILAEQPHLMTGQADLSDYERMTEAVRNLNPKAYTERPNPQHATLAPAGGAWKIEDMRDRAQARGPFEVQRGLRHPNDPTTVTGPALLFRQAGNGEDIRDGVLEEEDLYEADDAAVEIEAVTATILPFTRKRTA